MAQSGFTLIEVMWAIFILLIMMGAVAMGLSSTLNLTRNNSNRVVAANIASQKIDEMRQQAAKKFTDLPISYSSAPVVVDGVTYTVATDADWIPKGADSNPCDSSSDNPIAYVRITANVSWPQMNGVTPVTAATIITPPVKTFASGKGNVGVKVVGSIDNAAQEGLTVTLTAPGGTPTYVKKTSSAGCAFFAYVDPLSSGAYTVSLNEPGYVDLDGNQAVSKAATVIAGETADPLGFKYDLAATLNVTLTGMPQGGPTILLPLTPLPVTVENSEMTLSNGKHVFPAPATVSPGQVLTDLFPFSGTPYTAWAGDCGDSDPEGLDPTDSSRYYTSGLRDPGVLLTPGGTSNLVIQMQAIEFTVYKDSIDPSNTLADQLIIADHDAPIGECPSTTSYDLGRTDTSGKLVVAIPYGHFTFRVAGKSPQSGSWLAAVSTPPPDAIPAIALVTN